MMPNLDGFGLLSAVRTDPGLREVPVVMLSARAGDEARVEGLHVGANDYLVKPFSGRELVARIETQLAFTELRAKSDQERDRLFALLDDVPFALMVYEGPMHKIVVQNAIARQNLGRSAVGLTVAEAAPQTLGTALPADIEHVFRTGEPTTSVEVSFRKVAEDSSSEELFFTTRRQALRDERGDIWGVIAAAFDVTENVRARQAVEKAHREREKLLAQVEEASRAKDEFLAMLGHELRNPLAPILTAQWR
jgi:CheY-like chemotaxis protein